MPIEPIGWMLDTLQMLQAEKFAFESEEGINEVLSILDYVKESCDRLLKEFKIDRPDYEERESVPAITEKLEMLRSGVEYLNKSMINTIEERREKSEERRGKIGIISKEIEGRIDEAKEKSIDFMKEFGDFLDNAISSVSNETNVFANDIVDLTGEAEKNTKKFVNKTADDLNKTTKDILDGSGNLKEGVAKSEFAKEIGDKLVNKGEDFRKNAVQVITDMSNEIRTKTENLNTSVHNVTERIKEENKIFTTERIPKGIEDFSSNIKNREINSFKESATEVVNYYDNVLNNYDKFRIEFYEEYIKIAEKRFDEIIGFTEKMRNLTPDLQNWFDKESEKLDTEKEGGEEGKSTKESIEGLTKAADDLELAHAGLMETVESSKRVNETINEIAQENKIFSIDESLDRLQKKVDSIIGGEGTTPETEEKMSVKTSDTVEKVADAVTYEDLGIEVRDSKRAMQSDINEVKAKLDKLTKVIEKRAMTFDEIYKKTGERLERELKWG